MTTQTIEPHSPSAAPVETEVHDLYTSFNRAVLTHLLGIARFQEELSAETQKKLALATGRTPHFIQKAFTAAKGLLRMPKLTEHLKSSGEFDLDRLGELGRQIELFETLDHEELEETVLQLILENNTTPSAAKVRKAIREANYSTSQRIVPPVPHKTSSNTQGKLSEGISIKNHGDLSEIKIVCKSQKARSIHRFLKQTATSLGCNEIEALRKLTRGEKPPRLKLIGLELPSGKAFVEDTGWVSAEEMRKTKHLQSKEVLTEEEIAQIIFHVFDITTQ